MSDEQWIEHGGAVMPVQPRTKVRVRLRNGKTSDSGYAEAWGEQWTHANRPIDVVAYQLMTKPDPVPEQPQAAPLNEIQQQIRGLIVQAAIHHGVRISRVDATFMDADGGYTLRDVTFEMTSKC